MRALARSGIPRRRAYLAQLYNFTGRNVIVYSADFLSGGVPQTGIVLEDMQAMMEVCRGLDGPQLDLILHSPGGSAEATASIVRYLRRQFDDIRVFVPVAAMSAATMWALSGNRIVMGKHSQLGPIDPQLITPNGQFPARGIIEQFDRAKEECSKDPTVLGAWLPMLQQYGPSLLIQCEKAEELARELVGEWLEAYMFADKDDAAAKAQSVAAYFAHYGKHRSHNLGIDRGQARTEGVLIEDLEEDPNLQDAALSVHHSTFHTFSGPCIKLVENHRATSVRSALHGSELERRRRGRRSGRGVTMGPPEWRPPVRIGAIVAQSVAHPGRGSAATPAEGAGKPPFCRRFLSAPSRIRTCGLLLRRESLYPAELSGLVPERSPRSSAKSATRRKPRRRAAPAGT